MINAPSGGASKKAPRWVLSGTESCGSGIRFSWCSWMFGATWIYIGGRSRSVEQRGAHEGGGRAQGVGGRALHPRGPLVAPPTYFFLLYISIYPQTFRSTTKPYFHRRNLMYPSDPILGPFPELLRRGH